MKKDHRYGNCFLGALWLLWVHRTLNLRWLKRRFMPHFYVVDQAGTKWHFKVCRDVLPEPWCWIWFVGRFEAMKRGEKAN